MVLPARKFFLAAPRMISTPRQTEPPSDNGWQFRRRSGETGWAKSSGLLGNVSGIDDLFLLNRSVQDRAVA